MSQITIIGLGPGDPKHLTREAWDILSSIQELWLRTTHHPVVGHLPKIVQLNTFDALYESADTFALVYEEIAERIVTLGQQQDVVYAVPGHPFVGEATVIRIRQLAKERGVTVRIVAGLSFIEPLLTTLSVDALDGLQVLDALEIVALEHPPINPDLPAVISQVYSRNVASSLKLVLMNQYPDDYEVVFVDAAGTEACLTTRLPLYEIDRSDATPLTSLYIPPMLPGHSFESFQQTIAKLRSPEGCPWDREQTHKTLRTNLLEETYEVLSAIDADDIASLREELGDLLLQVVLHAQIAIEDGEFYMTDIIHDIDEKLKRRHPHVWGTTEVNGADDVVVNWEIIKRREREGKEVEQRSMLSSVPLALPSLAQAVEYIRRVRRVGLQWPLETWLPEKVARASSQDVDYARSWQDMLDKFQPFLSMQPSALSSEILGEMLMGVASLAIKLDIDLEGALREANVAFAERLKCLEMYLLQQKITFDSLTPAQVSELWNQINEQTPQES